ncbi:hypothetical protein EDD53_0265 [Pacificibacter maritimus]|uniref:Sulfotransferase family protein n=1 Tax=Pacificibacter maritimus TaxID=762213 RepID=A0A3N4UUA9_9RHOB|nr:hypothetical protein [Pacificibacter maritimus]RPE71151.1 hypothetical protein EDD53_0265 [Pacificibacter maritimus]
MKVYIHIGFPKCASSSLQATLFENEAKLKKNGVLYPKLGRQVGGYRNHTPIIKLDFPVAEYVEGALKEASSNKCDKIIISTESIVDNLRLERVQERCNTLAQNFKSHADVSVVTFSRSPSSVINSSFAQFLKAGLWALNRDEFFKSTDGTIDGFLDFFHEKWGFDLWQFENLYKMAIEVFEVDSLVDFRIQDGTDVIETFTNFVENGLSLTPSSVTNKRFSLEKLYLIRQFISQYGLASFQENAPILKGQVTFDKKIISSEQAQRDGMLLSRKYSLLLNELDTRTQGVKVFAKNDLLRS